MVKLEYGDVDHRRTGMIATAEVNATPYQMERIDLQRLLVSFVRRNGWASLATIVEQTRSNTDVEATDTGR